MRHTSVVVALVGVVGLFAIVQGLARMESFSMALGMMATGQEISKDAMHWAWFPVCSPFVPVSLIALGCILIFVPPRRFHQPQAGQAVQDGLGLSTHEICLIAATFAGVIILGWAMPKLFHTVINFTLSEDSLRREYLIRRTWPTVVGFVLQAALGFYLFLGAPHLVRWQVERTESMRSDQI